MHNHRSLFNMDISGGMPAVIIKMLVASGRRQDSTPARPARGLAFRPDRSRGVPGAVAIDSLQWDGKQVAVTLSCVKSQNDHPGTALRDHYLSITGDAAQASPAERTNQRLIALSSGQPVAMVITLK